ncbi:MAG: AEC family transporter [Acidobacteria bacterium]|nr:AEC family transporter [Acidobacteriota bacterium]
MSILISIFVSDILPIFVIALVGLLLARFLQTSARTLAHVVFYALLPCLVFKLVVTSQITGPEAGRIALLAVLVTAAMGFIARAAAVPLKLTRPELSAFLLVAMFSNSGNYGLPVVLFAFGTEALSYATIYFVTSSILTNTVGVSLAAAGRRSATQAILGVVKVPSVYGAATGLMVLAIGAEVPIGIMRPVGLLGDAALPLMVLVLGMQLNRSAVIEKPVVLVAAVVLSLFAAPLVALAMTSLLGVSGLARQAVVTLASTPVAVVTTILALEFDVAPGFVRNAVFFSTLLSPITITPIIAYLKQ